MKPVATRRPIANWTRITRVAGKAVFVGKAFAGTVMLVGMAGVLPGFAQEVVPEPASTQSSKDSMAKNESPAMQIDHVILAINDLESGMKEFEELSGVEPIYGGSHPDRDTHNAIAPLSGGIYVEILAPKDGLDAMPDFFKDFRQLTLVGFAIAARDLERVESSVRAQELDTGGIVDGSRKTPDGGKLAWRLLLINDPESFMNPFFIRWSDDSEHPSKSQPPRCELQSLKLTTLHKRQIERILSESGAEIPTLTIEEGEKQLTLELKTPKGALRFES